MPIDVSLPTHTPSGIRDVIGVCTGRPHRGNASGASVYYIESPALGPCYLKAQHAVGGGALRAEHRKLLMLHPVCDGQFGLPSVLAFEEVGEWSYLVMSAVAGTPAHLAFEETPLRVARLMGRTLRRLHSIGAGCIDEHVTLPGLLERAAHRVQQGSARPHGLHSLEGVTLKETPKQRLDRLKSAALPEAAQHRVLTHGDFCLPNLLLDLSDAVGLIDVGAAAIADRHRDLALGVRSLRYNGAKDDAVHTFLLWYGVDDVDPDRLMFWGDLLEML